MKGYSQVGRFGWSSWCLVCVFVAALGCRPGYKRDIERAKTSIRAAVGNEDIRAWADQTISTNKSLLNVTNKVVVENSRLPHWLVALDIPYPLAAVSVMHTNGQNYVSVVWASGRGVIGMHVADDGARPKGDRQRYIVNMGNGIYLWTVTEY